MITLGPFELFGLIGRGGMGQVWQGVHREHGLPVAVKVLGKRFACDRAFRAGFLDEARAVAALEHPAIVTVFDYGKIPAESSAASAGRLPEGSPYLAMEMADGGTISRYRGVLAWRELRLLLLRLLDALAHAHARGVIHRDLKPGNLLLTGNPTELKLTDFGLAHALDRIGGDVGDSEVRGTPAYMAPEQVEGRWREFGPWTDLYAVGCLSWTMITGDPPFQHADPWETLEDQLHAPPPRLRPRIAVPRSVVRWLDRLLVKDARRRFTRAADAAWALMQVGDDCDLAPTPSPGGPPRSRAAAPALVLRDDPRGLPVLGPLLHAGRSPAEGPSQTLRRPRVPLAEEPTVVLRLGPSPAAPKAVKRVGDPAPLPADWRRTHPPPPSLRLIGAGLGLYGLRSVRLVDRESERDQLWKTLRAASEERRGHLVLLQGPAGAGKSRLAEWMCERAHEVGIGEVFHAVHGPGAGAGYGIAPMVSRKLRLAGLGRRALTERLTRTLRRQGWFSPTAVGALTDLVGPAVETQPSEESQPILRFGSADERYGVIGQLMRSLAKDRVVVVHLDDLLWSRDSILFSRWLLDYAEAHRFPVVLLLTVADEQVAERPHHRDMLDDLMQSPLAMRLPIGPLQGPHRLELVQELLALEATLAEKVERRSDGNPLFAVQLVRDWVERDALVLGERGFELKRGVPEELPENLRGSWQPMVERFITGRPQQDALVLELAAVLGQVVNREELEAVCALRGIHISDDLVDALLTARLGRLSRLGVSLGWTWVHGMLREVLESRARSAGRLEEHHRTAAEMLKQIEPPQHERLGRHLMAGGLGEAALEPLMLGARSRNVAADYLSAETLLVEREAVMEGLGLPERDPRWGAGWVLRGWALRMRGDYQQADSWAQRAEDAGREHGWGSPLIRALVERGRMARIRGELELAWRLLGEAEVMALRADDLALIGQVQTAQGDVLEDRGELDKASDSYWAALETYRKGGDALGEAHCHRGLGVVAYQHHRLDAARQHLREALRCYEHAGNRWGVASTLNSLGEVARNNGDDRDAEEHYRSSLETYRAMSNIGAVYPEINLGLLFVDRRQWVAARELLDGCLAQLERRHRRSLAAYVHVALMPCVAALGDWAAWSWHLRVGTELIVETGYVQADIADLATRAGDAALAAGHEDEAILAWQLAVSQWRELGRCDEQAQVEARLGDIARAGKC